MMTLNIINKWTCAKWDKKRHEVLKHCIDLLSSKNNKNIVVLFNPEFTPWGGDKFSNELHEYKLVDDIKQVAQDQKVVIYPSRITKENGIANIRSFTENKNHILVTEEQYFNGCETSNLIYLFCGYPRKAGIRNCILRGIQNVICIQHEYAAEDCRIEGMKEDYRFWENKIHFCEKEGRYIYTDN